MRLGELEARPQHVIAMALDAMSEGFTSPTRHYSGTTGDRPEMKIQNQVSMFIALVSGDSMGLTAIYGHAT